MICKRAHTEVTHHHCRTYPKCANIFPCAACPSRLCRRKTKPQDMLSRVRDQRPSHNNSAWITSSLAVSRAKLLYYNAFAYLYGIAGGFFASRVMVNSTWTRGHIAALWKRSPPPTVVFPPCDTSELEVKQHTAVVCT